MEKRQRNNSGTILFSYFCEHEKMPDLKENEKFYTINISTKTIAHNYTCPSPYTRICINKLI